MELDVKSFLDGIKGRTNIDFTVFDRDGECVFGDKRMGESVPLDVQGVFSDVGLNRTVFRFKLKNKEYIGRIVGAGMTERNYATLIAELAERTFFKEPTYSKEEFVKALVFNELNSAQIVTNMRKYSFVDGEGCVMLVSFEAGKGNEILNVLTNYSSPNDFAIKIDNNTCALIKFTDEVAGEYHSFTEFAEFIAQSVLQELGIQVQISLGSTVMTFADLNKSFVQATSTYRMVMADGVKGAVHSYKEYTLVKMFEDLSREKQNEYLNLLLDPTAKQIFEDDEMIETAEEFLNNSLNQSETARTLYLHRNTLTYRLDKIEKATGLNIRKFSDAVTFRLITILLKLTR